MRIRTLHPHPALRSHVVRYLSGAGAFPVPFEQFTGPAGGPAIIVLMEGAQLAPFSGSVLEPTPASYFCGNLDRALLTVLSGSLRFFAVHFTATGAYGLLRLSTGDLTNRGVELAALARPDLLDWADALPDAPDDAARASATDRVLLAAASRSSARRRTPRVLETATGACELIVRSGGRIRVEALAHRLHTTPRTLRRHFDEVVGLPVRTHRGIVRFLAVRAYLDRHPDAPWGTVAFRFGYADQSHLVRDFRRYCGESPSAFRSRQREARLITLMPRDPGDVADAAAAPGR
jgi:AraC-like DNA-binding protein